MAEENVLADPKQMYVGDSQLVRGFAKAIYEITGTRPVDPDLFALVHETMAYGGKVDWRYQPYQR